VGNGFTLGGRVLELGCGTALPMMAIWQWVLEGRGKVEGGLNLGLADYNPSVLQLVTLPNLLLSWGQYAMKGEWEEEGEMDIDDEIKSRFLADMGGWDVHLSFFSGAWSPDFVTVVGESMAPASGPVMIIGAETIYSPFALKSFAETLICLLESMNGKEKTSLVAAKKVYFGVGGSMEDFCEIVRGKGASVEQIREESDGVRRAVVEVKRMAS
jgi:protein-histidine N-methyltransferase